MAVIHNLYYLCGIAIGVHVTLVQSQDVPVSCGGFIKADFPVDFTKIQVKLYTANGVLRDSTDCAPNNGYFLIPLYDRGEFSLKVDAPDGWKLEPSEVTVIVDGAADRCSRGEDINFKLMGFSVYGQVVSAGLKVGPSGVSLQLQQDDSIVQSTVTVAEGRFVLEGVPPGSYMLQASHSVWQTTEAGTKVVVTDNSVEVPLNTLVVLGYNVKGHVASDSEPIPGVQFLLYSEPGHQIDCELTEGPPGTESRRPSCVAVSDNFGQFVFTNLPPGHYDLVPYYRQNDIDFKVHPTEAQFVVFNDTVIVEPSFEVHGFSVSGRVLRTKEGVAIPGAVVYVDGEEMTRTDSNGQYQLLNVTTGRYTIKVEAVGSEVYFDELQVYLSPSDPSIPTIIPSMYGVCGHVRITHPPSPSMTSVSREVQAFSTTLPAVVIATVETDVDSDFCVPLPLGEYKIKVVLTEDEAAQGLMIQPTEQLVAMKEQPLSPSSWMTFEQYLATVTGSVTCLGKCEDDVEVTLSRSSSVKGTKGQQLQTKIKADGKTGRFTFSDVLPGHLKISVVYPRWCWSAPMVDVEVVTTKHREVVFEQTGFSMQYSVSHDIPVTYFTGNQSGVEVVLSGTGHICLTKPGVYTIRPKSCHKFQQELYKFDTSSPEDLVLTAMEHYVNVSVLAEKEDKDLSITIRSLRFGSDDQTLKSLKVARQPAGDDKTPSWKYFFSFLAKPQDDVEITPVSSELMFSPHTRVVTIASDCPEEVSPFLGSPGLMVIGLIQPPLEGVYISIQTEEDGTVKATTNSQGQYRAGPLHGGKQLSVTAELEGYTFEPLQDDPQSFKALKLSKITIKVLSGSGAALPNVLVSLSGANFRSNNFTSEEGTLEYYRLNPGQYFIKTLLREYEFQPASKVIDLVQGQSEEIVFTGTRVAFSCSGRVTTLNKQSLEGAVVKASVSGGGEQCLSYGGEASTDSNGTYKLRGLLPGCEYTVFVSPDESSLHRTLPTNRHTVLTDHDIEEVEFVAILHPTQIFITGNVITDPKNLAILKAQLSSDTKDSSIITSVSVDTAGFFDFPPVPLLKEGKYIVTLESNLSPHSHTFTRVEEMVPGDEDSHLTLKFSAEEIVTVVDSQRGSIAALIIAVLVIFAIANFEKVFMLVQSSVINFTNGQSDSSISSTTENRKKNSRRR